MDDASSRDFSEFYKTTVQWTFGVAYRAAGGDKDAAYDATQEAYVVLLERWLADKPEHPSRYIMGIAVRKVAGYYRSYDRCVPLDSLPDSGRSDDEAGDAELLAEVRDCLDSQPEKQRLVGVLYFLGEFDYAEIAKILEISISTVSTHVQRLREKLQPLITKDGRGGEQP